MDFFTHIIEDENGSEMKVFVRYGYDIYLTKEKNNSDYQVLTEILDSFLKYYLPKYYEGKVIDTEKRMEELIDEKEDLQEEITDDAAKIEKLKKEIKNLEENLKANNEQLATASKKLVARNEKLDKIRKQVRKL